MSDYPIATHRDALFDTARSVLEFGRDPEPQFVAFSGDKWLGSCIVPRTATGHDWSAAGRWAYLLDADGILVMADASVLVDEETAEVWGGGDAVVVLLVNLVCVLDAWACAYALHQWFGTPERIKTAKSGPASVLASNLRGDVLASTSTTGRMR